MRTTSDSDLEAFRYAKPTEGRLRTLGSYLYSMQDYDPVLFHQYEYYADKRNPLYRRAPYVVIDAILADALLYWHSDSAPMPQQGRFQSGQNSRPRFLLENQLILQVHAADVRRNLNPIGSHEREDRYAFVLVHDRLKGQRFIRSLCAAPPRTNDTLSDEACIKLMYQAHSVTQRSGHVSISLRRPKNDSLLQRGRDYIVVANYLYEDTYEPREVYPIVNGEVQDASNNWGFGTSVPLQLFKDSLRAKISEYFHQ